MSFPPCPQCASELAYNDGIQWVCPECGHEWLEGEQAQAEEGCVVKDSNGTVLQDGDSVTLIKDLKIKGSSQVIKQGTKVKNIRIVDGDHDIACKIEGSNMMLKSEFLKKI